jgi:hypothetical protein
MARMACGGLLLFPPLFAVGALAVMLTVSRPSAEPLLVVVLAVVALAILPAAPIVRDRVARVGIAAHLAGEEGLRRPRSVYAGFATATITGFMIAQAPALFGFIGTVLMRMWTPLVVGSVLSYAVWLWLWPRRRAWVRWSRQAEIRGIDAG